MTRRPRQLGSRSPVRPRNRAPRVVPPPADPMPMTSEEASDAVRNRMLNVEASHIPPPAGVHVRAMRDEEDMDNRIRHYWGPHLYRATLLCFHVSSTRQTMYVT